ncbi:MAG: dihydrolipoyl dehydrogenase family protein [Ruegeria sp.]
MERITTDILVIGAGSGGLSVAAGAAQMGARVVLLEGGEMGGDCLNAGCVPSKALIAAAEAAHAPAQAARFGVTARLDQVDFAAVMDHVRDVIATIAPHDSQERFEGLGVRVIRAFGRFVSPTEVDAGNVRIAARRIVLATGSRPAVPPIPGLDQVPYLTNETLFSLAERPDHLMVIGGGPIGLEMAQAFCRLGSRVSVVEAARALGREDPDLAKVVIDGLRAEGVDLREGTPVDRVAGQDGGLCLTLGDGTRLSGSHLLVATGRRPATEGLNLAAAGIDRDGPAIRVDNRMRTSNRRVFAIGDVTGGAQFTHVAGYHAGLVIRSAVLGLPAKTRTDHVPRVTFTDPELAQIGLTDAEAREKFGDRVETARFDFDHLDRAVAERATEGFIKVMVVRGRPVGASIVGRGAGEAANFWALALASRLKISAISGMISPYPTRGELSKRAAGAYFSPKLFKNRLVKRVVGAVQRWLP